MSDRPPGKGRRSAERDEPDDEGDYGGDNHIRGPDRGRTLT